MCHVFELRRCERGGAPQLTAGSSDAQLMASCRGDLESAQQSEGVVCYCNQWESHAVGCVKAEQSRLTRATTDSQLIRPVPTSADKDAVSAISTPLVPKSGNFCERHHTCRAQPDRPCSTISHVPRPASCHLVSTIREIIRQYRRAENCQGLF